MAVCQWRIQHEALMSLSPQQGWSSIVYNNNNMLTRSALAAVPSTRHSWGLFRKASHTRLGVGKWSSWPCIRTQYIIWHIIMYQ
jgi:hypothetical protein